MSCFHLYRHYDADGNLLYVGQSNNAFTRYNGHRSDREWIAASVMMRVESFNSREEVLLAERQAIRLERPRFNRCFTKDTCLLSMRVSTNFLAKIDRWRASQPDVPSRTEAIRRLVEQALSTGKKR